MSATQPQLTPLGESGTLFDDDDFFEAAARGELPETRPGCAQAEDHNGVGAATLPRLAASTATPGRRPAQRARARRRQPRRASAPRQRRIRADAPRGSRGRLALTVPRRVIAGALAAGCAAALLVVALAPRGPGATSRLAPAREAVALAPVVITPGRPPGDDLDVVSPRLLRLRDASRGVSTPHGPAQLSVTVADAGTGVSRVTLLGNGHSAASAHAPCRGACPSAARFRFRLQRRRSRRPLVLALAARDGAGNRTLLWQRLFAPRGAPGRTRLTATFARQESTELTLATGAPYIISGRLTTPLGAALARRRVELLAVARRASGRSRRLASATTDRAGRWSTAPLRARRGELLIARDATRRGGASSAALELTVRSPLRARRVGRRVVGRLGPGARGTPVVLAQRTGRRWRALVRARATGTGRYRLRLPSTTHARRLAVFAGEAAGWPYAPASRLVAPHQAPRRP